MGSSMHDVRICFIGDSFVNGTMDRAYQGWPGRLCAALSRGQREVTLYNLGIRRETSRDIAQRWRDEAERRLPQGIDCRLVFSFGVNDCTLEEGRPRVEPQESVAFAREIIQAARAWLPVLWVGPPPVSRASVTNSNERIASLSAQYARLALELGVPYCDLHSELVQRQDWEAATRRGDGAHPDALGYELIQSVVESSSAWQGWWPSEVPSPSPEASVR